MPEQNVPLLALLIGAAALFWFEIGAVTTSWWRTRAEHRAIRRTIDRRGDRLPDTWTPEACDALRSRIGRARDRR